MRIAGTGKTLFHFDGTIAFSPKSSGRSDLPVCSLPLLKALNLLSTLSIRTASKPPVDCR